MSQEVIPAEASDVPEEAPQPASEAAPEPALEPALEGIPETAQDVSEGSEKSDEEYGPDYGEGKYFEGRSKGDEVFPGEIEDKEWVPVGEYAEGGPYFIYKVDVEGGEAPSVWGEVSSISSAAESEGKIEAEEEKIETEEEKEQRKEREALIQDVRQKIVRRTFIKARNSFLQKKLVEHFKKRRMESVLKEDPKGLDLDAKYLKRLYAFQEFRTAQENEIEELNNTMVQYENNAKSLKEDVDEQLKNFMTRAYDVSLTLISSKTGKKLNEKQVNRLLRREVQKSEEKGKKKLKYIKLKSSIEELEQKLRDMEYIGEGLYFHEYEQLKIDNMNYNDKIEEKVEEFSKIRDKTQKIMQILANFREKSYAVEEDIELMEEQVYEVEMKFDYMRQRLTKAKKKRDSIREEGARLKAVSGLLSKPALLLDFEDSHYKVKALTKQLEKFNKHLTDKKRQHEGLLRMLSSSFDFSRMDMAQPSFYRSASKKFF